MQIKFIIANTQTVKLFLTGLFVSLFFAPVFAFAVTPLQVEFEKVPLFKDTNFLPGDSVTRFVKVTNNTGSEQTTLAEIINETACSGKPSCFADKIFMKVTKGSTEYFNGTLSAFYDSEHSLGTIADGATEKYDFTVSFPEGDNAYQNTTTTQFDLLVGFSGVPGGGVSSEGGTSSGGGSVGGGGGGGTVLQGLQISREEASTTEQAGQITVTWRTNYASYGHVIYGPASGNYILNLSAPHFGYVSSVPSDPSAVNHTDGPKTMDHSFLLAGLPPGEYKYRVVSHASPPTVGYEHTFTVSSRTGIVGTNGVSSDNSLTPDANDSIGRTSEGAISGNAKNQNGSLVQNGNALTDKNSETVSTDENAPNNSTGTNNLAGALGAFGNLGTVRQIFVAILLILIVAGILWFVGFVFRKKKDEK